VVVPLAAGELGGTGTGAAALIGRPLLRHLSSFCKFAVYLANPSAPCYILGFDGDLQFAFEAQSIDRSLSPRILVLL
jgi:hypothetical protein